jgi:hypothetical protein
MEGKDRLQGDRSEADNARIAVQRVWDNSKRTLETDGAVLVRMAAATPQALRLIGSRLVTSARRLEEEMLRRSIPGHQSRSGDR